MTVSLSRTQEAHLCGYAVCHSVILTVIPQSVELRRRVDMSQLASQELKLDFD